MVGKDVVHHSKGRLQYTCLTKVEGHKIFIYGGFPGYYFHVSLAADETEMGWTVCATRTSAILLAQFKRS